MTDIDKIILGAFGAITVYVAGQILSKFFIEPVHDLRKEIGEVRFNLAFHASTIHTPIGRTKELSDDAKKALMKNSCQLIAKVHAVPLFSITRYIAFGVIPRRNSIEDATVQLRALTTYLHEEGEKALNSLDTISKRVTKIEKLLGLKPLE